MRRFATAGLLAAMAGALAFVVAEVALRVLKLAPSKTVTTVSAAEFGRVPGLLSPGTEIVDLQNPALPHRVRVDSLGFRGQDFSRVPPEGTFRIAMLGDSFVYGTMVDDEATLPAQLQQRLAPRCGPVEVVNAGLSGATIIEQLEVARRVLPLRPALVVVTFTENDVTDLGGESTWSQLARSREAKSGFPLRYLYPVLRESAVWNLAMKLRGMTRTANGHDGTSVLPTVGAAKGGVRPDSARRARYEATLSTLASELRAANVPAVFVTFPAHFTVYDEWSEEQLDWAASVAQRQGLPVIATLPAFRGSRKPATELFLLPLDGHPSGVGHALAADTLATALRAHPTLTGRCGTP